MCPQALASRKRETLATWRAAASEQAATRRLLHHAVRRMAHAKLASALAGWRSAAAARGRKRELMQRAATLLRNRHALRALNSWRDYAAERVVLRGNAQEVVKRMLLRRLYAGFRWARVGKAGARWIQD